MTEKDIQNNIRIRISELRGLSLRYQVGLFFTKTGIPVKIGEPGTSDLICAIPKRITTADVGKTIAVFTAIETKKENDSTDKARKISQGNFISRIKALGGYAGIAKCNEDLEKIINP